ncbi:MAG: carboxy terminal-processing peptidase [Desulfuromonadaceae bacterium]|nr:carboxy terminal-processing peptidase [Desulfuromonadaceae bacterium]
MNMFRSSNFVLRSLIVLLVGLLLLGVGSSSAGVSRNAESFEVNRQRLLSYLLSQQLTQNHYRDQALDDQFSAAAFKLYLQQLDSQKRFLLKEDVLRLQAYEQKVDNEVLSGYLELPEVGAVLHRKRIDEAEILIRQIMADGFHFRTPETLQVDPEKLDYCQDRSDLRERWRKVLKYQVFSRYLELLEEQDKAVSKTTEMPSEYRIDTKLMAIASDKVLKSMEQLLLRLRQITQREYVDRYFDAVCRAFDPHTNYLAPAEEEEFEISMKGSLEGIGATLQQDDGFIKVISIIPGSPAFRQGQLQAEDIILKVAQGTAEPIDIVDSSLRDAVRLIRGKKGTEVRLTVRKPAGIQQVIPIVRDVVQIQESFVRSTLLKGPAERGGNFGYIRIPTFYRDFFDHDQDSTPRNCTDDVRAALEKLSGSQIDGLVIDLRNNGGGALTDAVQIAGLFVKQGPVVQVRDSAGRIAVLKDKDPGVAFDGPMIVLVNRFSASASEILAAALQDYRRALVVGDHVTHGKGTVQTVLNLDSALPPQSMDEYRPLGAMKLTLQKFYRVSGGSTQVQGVEPDILLPDPLPFVQSGERYTDYALPWDTIAPVSYTPWQAASFDIDALRAASQKRLASSPRFKVLTELRKRSQDRGGVTARSLDLADLWQEHSELINAQQMDAAVKSEKQVQEGPIGDGWLARIEKDLFVGEAVQILGDLRGRESFGNSLTKTTEMGR